MAESYDTGQEHQYSLKQQHANYKGFVAGAFSGIAKLTGKLDL